jgi:hypothetical protein
MRGNDGPTVSLRFAVASAVSEKVVRLFGGGLSRIPHRNGGGAPFMAKQWVGDGLGQTQHSVPHPRRAGIYDLR